MLRVLVQGVHSEGVQVEALVYKVSVYSMATPQGGRALPKALRDIQLSQHV